MGQKQPKVSNISGKEIDLLKIDFNDFIAAKSLTHNNSLFETAQFLLGMRFKLGYLEGVRERERGKKK